MSLPQPALVVARGGHRRSSELARRRPSCVGQGMFSSTKIRTLGRRASASSVSARQGKGERHTAGRGKPHHPPYPRRSASGTAQRAAMRSGPSPGSQIILLPAPSRPEGQWPIAGFVTGHSCGAATVSHRLPEGATEGLGAVLPGPRSVFHCHSTFLPHRQPVGKGGRCRARRFSAGAGARRRVVKRGGHPLGRHGPDTFGTFGRRHAARHVPRGDDVSLAQADPPRRQTKRLVQTHFP